MEDATEHWFARRTWQEPPWTVAELVAAKRGRRVSVVLPALDEEATVGAIVAAIVPLTPATRSSTSWWSWTPGRPTARSRSPRRRAPAWCAAPTSCPSCRRWPGKGEVLWRALAATTGDVLCYLDSDLVDFDPAFVPALLGPLLVEDRRAPREGLLPAAAAARDAVEGATGGGRVTELLVRPLLAALRPELAGVVQPLGGEYAGTRELLESLPFAAGTGWRSGCCSTPTPSAGSTRSRRSTWACASTATASLLQLGVMARQILAAALHHCGVPDAGAALTQFVQVGGEWLPSATPVVVAERPPMREVRVR